MRSFASRLVQSFLIATVFLSFGVATAFAQHQPMAVAPFEATLAAGSSTARPAYCSDRHLPIPQPSDDLRHVILGGETAIVRRSGVADVPLADAIASGLVAVRGSGDYSISFENRWSDSITIVVPQHAAFGDQMRELPYTHAVHSRIGAEWSGVSQYWVWRGLGQAGPIVRLEVFEVGEAAEIIGYDASDEAVAVVGNLVRSDVTRTIAEIVDQGSTVAIRAVSASRLYAILTDLQLRTELRIRPIGLGGAFKPADLRAVVTGLREAPTERSASGTDVAVAFTLDTTSEGVDGLAHVHFDQPQAPSAIGSVRSAVQRVIRQLALRLRATDSVGSVANAVHVSVEHELEALTELEGDRGAVWVFLRTRFGFAIVRVNIGEASSSWT